MYRLEIHRKKQYTYTFDREVCQSDGFILFACTVLRRLDYAAGVIFLKALILHSSCSDIFHAYLSLTEINKAF